MLCLILNISNMIASARGAKCVLCHITADRCAKNGKAPAVRGLVKTNASYQPAFAASAASRIASSVAFGVIRLPS